LPPSFLLLSEALGQMRELSGQPSRGLLLGNYDQDRGAHFSRRLQRGSEGVKHNLAGTAESCFESHSRRQFQK
jgi:hypothetical protein